MAIRGIATTATQSSSINTITSANYTPPPVAGDLLVAIAVHQDPTFAYYGSSFTDGKKAIYGYSTATNWTNQLLLSRNQNLGLGFAHAATSVSYFSRVATGTTADNFTIQDDGFTSVSGYLDPGNSYVCVLAITPQYEPQPNGGSVWPLPTSGDEISSYSTTTLQIPDVNGVVRTNFGIETVGAGSLMVYMFVRNTAWSSGTTWSGLSSGLVTQYDSGDGLIIATEANLTAANASRQLTWTSGTNIEHMATCLGFQQQQGAIRVVSAAVNRSSQW